MCLHKQVLSKTFQEYRPASVFLSFNGGKDCTVLLHFVIQLFRELLLDSRQLICIHVQPEHPFDEVEQFVRDCEKYYNVSIQNRHGSIKETLFTLCNEQKELKACIMGCRRTDPYCSNLNTLQVKRHSKHKNRLDHNDTPLGHRSRLAPTNANKSITWLDPFGHMAVLKIIWCTLLQPLRHWVSIKSNKRYENANHYRLIS